MTDDEGNYSKLFQIIPNPGQETRNQMQWQRTTAERTDI